MRWLPAACAALWLGCLPGAAGAAALTGDVVADGERWAAWTPSPGVAVVHDDRSRRQRRLAIPACPVSAVGAGTLLLTCPSATGHTPDPVLVDLDTGAATNVAGPELTGDTFDDTRFVGVGARGIAVEVDGYHHRTTFAFDWTTRLRTRLDERRRTMDLDRAGLTRRLCAPLSRTRSPGDALEEEDPYVPLLYARPWAAENVTRAGGGPGRVRLWRCGRARARTLARCHCRDLSIGAGLVSWTDGTRAHAYEPATGRRRSWRQAGSGYARVSRAGRTLFLWTQRSTIDDPPALLRTVRWPVR